LNRCVFDASVIVKWYLPENFSDKADELRRGVDEFHAPDFMCAEFANVLWKRVMRGEILQSQAETILSDFGQLDLWLYPARQRVMAASKIAADTRTAVYDSLYLALAVELDCQFVTDDQKLFDKLLGHELASRLLMVGNISAKLLQDHGKATSS
jgi:predicted nucleic acid-binding protein